MMSKFNSIPQFSFFRSPVYNLRPYKHLTASEIFIRVSAGDFYSKQTAQLRSITNNQEATKYKQLNFDFACFSGTFTQRNEAGLIYHSGLICIDFDHLTDKEKLREKLLADPNLSTVLLFTSPSGTGLKWIVQIDVTRATHIQYFEAIENYIFLEHQIKIDASGKDVARACFLPFDPECYFNQFPAQKQFDLKMWLPARPKPQVQPEKRTPTAGTSKQPTVEDIIQQIESYRLDLTANWKDWIKIGFAFASEYNEAGREYFHRVSRFYDNYSPVECDKQFDRCLKSGKTGVGIKSFFWLAKEAGIEIS